MTGNNLDAQTLIHLAHSPTTPLAFSDDAQRDIAASREILDTLIAQGETIYGVNTNRGGMARWLLPEHKRQEVQHNLIQAVASNVGPYFDDVLVRAAMIARLNALARGNSAVSPHVANQLLAMVNSNIVPCVPSLGSLGTSGDLGPLAAIAQVAVGKGYASVNGQKMPGLDALHYYGLEPVELSYKDGLALINGTSFMCAVLAAAYCNARALMHNYMAVSALSFGCLHGKKAPISPAAQRFKHHIGQHQVAMALHALLEEMDGVVDDSHLSQSLHKERLLEPVEGSQQVEDHYSLRCTPQVLGPIVDTLNSINTHLNNEINSASDNPLIDIDHHQVYHCGHFHGQYLSMAADHLKLAMSTLANLAERRVDRLLDKRKNEHLAAFLAQQDAGIRLGLMGSQFMSSSITAELRSNVTPMSNQTLPTTADFQDTVSLGLVASRQALESTNKCAYVLGCELFLGCQAADMMSLTHMPAPVASLYNAFRHRHPFRDADRDMTAELETAHDLLLSSAC